MPMDFLSSSVGLLVLRLGFGLSMLFGHGWGKLINFTQLSGSFPDPIGAGSTTSLILAIFAEVICAFLITIGLFTRLAAIPLIVTMLTAFFLIHMDDPWSRKELAATYGFAFICIFCSGPGKYSLDSMRRR